MKLNCQISVLKIIITASCLLYGNLQFCNGLLSYCYDYLGCFNQEYPWISLSRPFPPPISPVQMNVTLRFFSREKPAGQWFNIYPNIDFKVTGFSPSRRTVTITHGFASSGNAEWVIDMKDKYLQNVDANVFLVNWEQGADFINYLQAAANTRVVGAILGRFGKFLIYSLNVNYNNFHMIGHSLGSHITGYAANIMNTASPNGEKVSWITGLDVAQPGFQSLPPIVRLNKDNAKFVETIHTDAKVFIPFFGFGYLTPLGDIDFYLNRGYNQPKCLDLVPILNITSITQLVSVPVEVISKAISCSHGRSYEIYTASMDPDVKCKFVGHRVITLFPLSSNQFTCGLNGNDCVTMGLDTPKQSARGAFQVMTAGSKPYCCGTYSPVKGCSNDQKRGFFSALFG